MTLSLNVLGGIMAGAKVIKYLNGTSTYVHVRMDLRIEL